MLLRIVCPTALSCAYFYSGFFRFTSLRIHNPIVKIGKRIRKLANPIGSPNGRFTSRTSPTNQAATVDKTAVRYILDFPFHFAFWPAVS